MRAHAPASDPRRRDIGFEVADGRTRRDEPTAGTSPFFLEESTMISQESTMISRRALPSMWATWSREVRRGATAAARRRRRRPVVERMESRALLSTIAQFPIPSPAWPGSIVVGPDGNLWYTLARLLPFLSSLASIDQAVSIVEWR